MNPIFGTGARSPGTLVRLTTYLTGVRPREAATVLFACAYFFCVLAAYFVIRPIREEMGVAGGVENLQWLFTGTLAGMLLVHPLFSATVSRWPRRRFVTVAYRFFMANLVLFSLLLNAVSPEATVWVGRVFFVWTSVFNMFVVSVFWSFMTDIFREIQSRRLFGLVGIGGTLGAIAGASATAVLAPRVEAAHLLWLSVLLLEVAVVCVKAIDKRHRASRPHAHEAGPGSSASVREATRPRPSSQIIGGSPWDGIRRVLASRYLTGICIFIVLFTTGSTFLYNIQADIMYRTFPDPGQRTSVFAQLDLAVQVLTLLTQLFFTGRLLKRLGVGIVLAALPLFSVLGFAALAAAPVFAVFAAFQVLRRAGEYALSRPSREVLYTVLNRSDKYKAKNFIDTVVYRGGDQVGVWSFAAFRHLGGSTSLAALAMACLSVPWLATALWLGRQQKVRATRPSYDFLPGVSSSNMSEADTAIWKTMTTSSRHTRTPNRKNIDKTTADPE